MPTLAWPSQHITHQVTFLTLISQNRGNCAAADGALGSDIAGIRLANAGPANMRAASGKRMPRIGYLYIDGQPTGLPCTLRSYDGKSATLLLSGWLGVPAQFTLYVEPDGMRHDCTIGARRGNSIEVTLSDGIRETRPRGRR